jgi:cation:H+ antiporter
MNYNLIILLQIFAILLILIPLNGLIIRAFSILAQKLKLSRTFILIFIVGFAASIPELFIGINSAIQKQPEVGVGNAIGTGIILISFVAGIIAVYNKKFKTNKVFGKNNLAFISAVTLIFILLGLDGVYSRVDGAILIGVYLVYLILLAYYKNHFEIKKILKISKKDVILNASLVVIGLVIAYFASYLINIKVSELNQASNFPLLFMGLLLLAPLSAIPELIFEFELHEKGLSEISLGELFTSLVTNTTLVIGVVILITPFAIANTILFQFAALFLCSVLVLFNIYIRSRNELDWKEGLILIFCYILFMLSAFSLIV